MPAPKGNKYALGNKGGRPRKYDLSEEAEALIEWANDPKSLVLRLFSAIRGYGGQEKMHEYCKLSDEFREAYNIAKTLIGARREEWLMKGKGHPAPFNRYAALYDPELKQHEKEVKESENNAFTGPLRIEIVDYTHVKEKDDSGKDDTIAV